jgi:translation initiation factor eIF-2B subunit delta
MIDETAAKIADMQTHSSSVVAIEAAQALRELTTAEFPTVPEYKRTLERNSNALRRANPSHASLHNTQRTIVERVDAADADTVAQAQSVTVDAIEDVVDAIESGKRRAAERAAPVLSDADTLLTHDYSTTVISSISRAVEDSGSLHVYVTEARPRFLGRKMARRLAEIDGVDTTLVVDSAGGHYLSACDRVVVGMDCIVDEVLYNRIGTYPLAATASDVGVPVTSIGSEAKIVDSGFAFENEQRSPSEVMLEPAEGFDVANPAYDGTPVRLLDSVITDEQIRTL